jgi:hypothetical protein
MMAGRVPDLGQSVLMAIAMENQERPERPNLLRTIKRCASRPRLVMGVLLIIALPIFVSLANKAVRENADVIRQGLGQ